MKKIVVTIIMLSAMLGLSACGSKAEWETVQIQAEEIGQKDSVPDSGQGSEDAQTGDTESRTEKNAETPGTEEQGGNQGTENADANADINFYGDWVAAEWKMPGIGAMSAEEADGCVGETFTFEKDYAVCMGEKLENPRYAESTIKEEELSQRYRGVSFESLDISKDAVTAVEIENAPDTCRFGSMLYLADENTIYAEWEGVFLRLERKGAAQAGENETADFQLTDEGKRFLDGMCRYLPEFSDVSGLNKEFWQNFLFLSYTGESAGAAESVKVFREDLDMEEQVVKVSESDVAAYVKLALGVSMPDFKPGFEEMQEGQTAFYYEDGYYYIGESDFPDYDYAYKGCTAADNGCYLVEYSVTFEGDPNAGTILFTVKPEKNANGFVILKKEDRLL